MNTTKIQQLLDAVPDIGDQRAREVTIARMAYEAGQVEERERCAMLCEERAAYAADVVCDEAERRAAQECACAIRVP